MRDDPSAPRETEAKFRVADRAVLERTLAALGASPGPRELETNVLLDDDRLDLKARGMALRVRRTAGRGLLTLKGKASLDRGIKTRIELESGVANPEAVEKLLATLGYAPRFRYEKWRTVWRFESPDRPLVVVDETPLGLFAEIEGEDGAVRALAGELGVPEAELIGLSYVALWEAAREAEPSLPRDMVFP